MIKTELMKKQEIEANQKNRMTRCNQNFITILITGGIAYFLYPEGILSTPFSELTIGNIIRFIGAILFGIMVIMSIGEELLNSPY